MSQQRRAQLELRDKAEAARTPLDHEWPPEITDPEVTESFWKDPDPGNTAVLAADLIYEYNYEVGGMIRPFQTKHLNTASYDLTLGPRCLVDGKERKLSDRQPILRIEPGSIAMAPSREMLFIPHWLVATFNLKSYYIFKGLLMGAGPQVDPGFMGVLTFPLHNISCEPVDLRLGAPFAKLDFIRTSWAASVDLAGIDDEDELYAKAKASQLRGANGVPVMLWPKEKSFREPLINGREPAGLKGFLRELKAQVRGFKRQLKFGWIGGISVAVAFLGIIVGITTLSLSYTNSRVDSVKAEAARAARVEARQALQAFGYPQPVRRTAGAGIP